MVEENLHNRYLRNSLKQVICRLDYDPILDIATQLPDKFQDAIRDELPRFSIDKLIEFKTSIQEQRRISENQEYPLYVFGDEDSTKKVTLGYNQLIIELTKYDSLSSFLQVANCVFSALEDSYGSIAPRRLGLRYINEIFLKRGNPFVWRNYLDPALTYVVDKFIESRENTARAMTQIVTNHENFKMNFIFGYFNSEFPSKISRKEFVLDFDCYTEDVEMDEITSCLTDFNHEIKRLFERCIKDGLRKHLEVANAE